MSSPSAASPCKVVTASVNRTTATNRRVLTRLMPARLIGRSFANLWT
jgi:hypothetical protein